MIWALTIMVKIDTPQSILLASMTSQLSSQAVSAATANKTNYLSLCCATNNLYLH
ncbi:exported hypothetical protein [Kamptonema sp. PCC 6506]|nr:exported hypothetical protein [Kamptonema sp. PCC 6506]